MVFKKLHIGSTVFRSEDIDDINQSILEALHEAPGSRKSMRGITFLLFLFKK